MSEERFEEWLRENADDYNQPPVQVPRDAMWAAIAAARRQHLVPRFGRNRDLARWAAAAVLLVTAGAGVGYWLRGAAGPASTVALGPELVASTEESMAIYDVASAQHLTAAEALLTSFRSDAQAESDQALRRWARDLLAGTRLLMDSPAGTNAARHKLLEDLEYVLAQIVQLAPDAPAADRALVEESIGREQVLTRIRSSIPAGFPSGN
ncbi:MAG TPA: hypothetical protein VF981_12190 [Gemmatimonadaceae bacterium]